MVEINLLPWRQLLRAKQNKQKILYGIVCAAVILCVCLLCECYKESQEKIQAKQSHKQAIQSAQPTIHAPPQQLAGYLHLGSRTWGILKSPNGECHEIPHVKIANPDFNHTQQLSLDLENIKLTEALRLIAKFMHFNIMIAPGVKGTVSLHLQDVPPNEVIDLLMTSQNLTQSRSGSVWTITPRNAFMRHKQEEMKLQEAVENAAPLQMHTWQIHYAKAEDIAHLLQDSNYSLLSKRGHIRVDSRTNKLYVQDLASHIALTKSLIQQFDIPVQQIQIEAHLASVDSDYERELGINFSVHNSPVDKETHAVSENVSRAARYSLAVAKLADGSLLDAALVAMENEGRGELISSPSLFTANQQTASIESGEEIPYQEVSLSGGTGIAFKKAVLSLKVTPQIMPGQQVLLELQINQDRPSSRIVLGVPAISTRQMTTRLLVKSGQTLVLGGIYELNKEHDEQRIPFLGKIPLVGLLFQQQNAKENKRELLIFVTPKIL